MTNYKTKYDLGDYYNNSLKNNDSSSLNVVKQYTETKSVKGDDKFYSDNKVRIRTIQLG